MNQLNIHTTAKQLPDFPKRVTIEITNNCNLSCRMCPRNYMTGKKGFMSLDLFKDIIDQVENYNDTAIVPFFRGEPLLHPEFVSMMGYIKQKGLGPVQLATNGFLLTEQVANAIVKLQLDFVSFSVDSIDPTTYEEVRKGASLDKVVKNIKRLCELKKEMGAAKPEIQVSVVKTDKTRLGIDSFIAYWQNIVDRVRVYEEHSSVGRFGALAKRMTDMCSERMPCVKPFTDMVIYWDGQVALCNHDWDRKDEIGDVNINSIAEIWNSHAYEKIRNSHLENRLEDQSPCAACDHWEIDYSKEGLIGELYGNYITQEGQ